MKAPETLKALADPTRVRIVMLLSHGDLCVCDLTETLRLPQSTVSRHMAVLRAAELVSDSRSGKWVHYRLSDSALVSELITTLSRHVGDESPYAEDWRLLKDRLAGKRWEEMGCE